MPMPTTKASPPRPRRTRKPVNLPQRWYPQRTDFKSYQEWDTHYRAWERIYALEDQVRGMAAQLTGLTATAMQINAQASQASSTSSASTASSGQIAKGPNAPPRVSATHLNNIAIEPGIPADGQKLTYRAVTGVFVFE